MNKHELVCYNTDASRIIGNVQGVFFPENSEEVQEIVKNSRFDIVPRGAGTGIEGGCIPKNSVVVDLCKMNKILDFNFSKKQVRAEAGITIKELNEKLKKANLEFPIYSSDKETSTLGGMVALNSPGNRSMKYGYVRDWVEEIQLVNGKGELIKTSKADLMDVCGMEGVTGIITSVSFKVLHLTDRTASILQTESLDEAFSIARQAKSEKEVSMLRLIPKKVSGLLGFPEKNHLIIEFDSDRGKIKGNEYKELFKKIDNIHRVLFSEGYYNIEDPKMFFDKVRDFVLFLEMNNTPYFGDLGTGTVYAFFKDDERIKRKDTRNLMKKIRAKLGKYGIGLNRRDLIDSFEAKLMQRVKMRYDPQTRLNKAKVVDMSAIDSLPRNKDEPKIAKKQTEIKPSDIKPEEKKIEPAKPLINNAANEISKPASKPVIDFNTINKIMTNQYGIDDLDKQKSDSNSNGNKQSDKDLINSIITNRFKKENNEAEKNQGENKNEPGN